MDSAWVSVPQWPSLDEFCDCVESAFLGPSASTSDLINAALSSDAPPTVLAALHRLPPRRYVSLLQVLSQLPELTFRTSLAHRPVRDLGRGDGADSPGSVDLPS